jgi:deazaflavin-dependent oxidoreductase (nitroreductase family)
MSNPKDFNKNVIEEFRANGGKVGGYFANTQMLLLTMKGAKSGNMRTTPLAYTKDGDKYVIAASKGGADTHPEWYHNLKAHPNVTVEVGTEKFEAKAHEAQEPERSRLYAAHADVMPGFAEYEKKTKRKIPVFVLERVDAKAHDTKHDATHEQGHKTR